jgi:signal transduction histidine kinase
MLQQYVQRYRAWEARQLHKLSPIEREQVHALNRNWKAWHWLIALGAIAAYASLFAWTIISFSPDASFSGVWMGAFGGAMGLSLSALGIWFGYRRYNGQRVARFVLMFIGIMYLGGLTGAFVGRIVRWLETGGAFDMGGMNLLARLTSTLLLIGVTLSVIYGLVIYLRNREHDAVEAARAAERREQQVQQSMVHMQLQVARAQLEPHFLFNTLAMIRRDVAKQPQVAQQSLDELITFLRGVLPQVQACCQSLDDELNIVSNYLALMKRRMGTRLEYTLHIAPEAAERDWPPGMLLTLVENAIKHGIEPDTQGGRIDVSAALQGSNFVVTVADTGRGLDMNSASGVSDGTGLSMVRKQLQALYGTRATIELAPNEPKGFVVRVTIEPVERSKAH